MSNYFLHLLQQSGLTESGPTESGLPAGSTAPLDAPRPTALPPPDMRAERTQPAGMLPAGKLPSATQTGSGASSDIAPPHTDEISHSPETSRPETPAPTSPSSVAVLPEEAPARRGEASSHVEPPGPPKRLSNRHESPRELQAPFPVDVEESEAAVRRVGEALQTPIRQEHRLVAASEQHVAEDDVARNALDESSPNGSSPNKPVLMEKPMLMEQVRAWVAATPDPGVPAPTAATSMEDRGAQAQDGARVAAAPFAERFQAAPPVAGPAHQDLLLSVGAIHLTLEAPAPAAAPPASPASSAPSSAPASSGFSQSRLLRRYLRIR